MFALIWQVIAGTIFPQATITGVLINRFIVGGADDRLIENYSIHKSLLNIHLDILEFTEAEFEFYARQDVNLVGIDTSEINRAIVLNKASVVLDLLNLGGIHNVPVALTINVGLLDKKDEEQVKMTRQEMEDVSCMELNDWGVCLEIETAFIGFRTAVSARELNRNWPHTLVSLYGRIDPLSVELALEAFADKNEAMGHFSAAVGYDFFLSENLTLFTGIDMDTGFIEEFSELWSWGWAAIIDYKSGKFHSRASIGATGRSGREQGMEISGQVLRGFSAVLELWPVDEIGLGLAGVFTVYDEAPSLLANTEVAALFRLGVTELALGYLVVPSSARNERLAEFLAWATCLKDEEGELASGIFFRSTTKF